MSIKNSFVFTVFLHIYISFDKIKTGISHILQVTFMENKLTIDIYGEQYPLKGDVDIEYMKKLAEIVDAKMHELVKKNQYLPAQRIGVLTALHIADDYFKIKKDYDELVRFLDNK